MRSLTLWTSTPGTCLTASTRRSEWSASDAEQVTSTTSRSWLESATSIAVTIPPSAAIAVATAPTTPWSGAVCSRMVIEYDDAVAADMPASLCPAVGCGQVAVVVVVGEPAEVRPRPIHL